MLISASPSPVLSVRDYAPVYCYACGRQLDTNPPTTCGVCGVSHWINAVPVASCFVTDDLVRCENLWFVDFDPEREASYLDQSFPAEPADDGDEADPFWRNYWDCLACCYPSVSGDDRSITTISDFYTSRQLHETGMYAEWLGPFGVENEAMMCLSAPAGRTRRLIFLRGRGSPDFDDRDRLLLSFLRPHLNELYQELESRRRVEPDLTPRQWELMRLVAARHSNAEIARELIVSVTTVRKHLENIFDRLGVTSRTGALARAFPSPPY